jgi:hypothetical protein
LRDIPQWTDIVGLDAERVLNKPGSLIAVVAVDRLLELVGHVLLAMTLRCVWRIVVIEWSRQLRLRFNATDRTSHLPVGCPFRLRHWADNHDNVLLLRFCGPSRIHWGARVLWRQNRFARFQVYVFATNPSAAGFGGITGSQVHSSVQHYQAAKC